MQEDQNKDHSSGEFLTGLSGGREESFRVLYDTYKNGVFSSAMTFLKDEQEATEITQRVFIRLWEKRHLLTNVEQLQDYLFTVTRNLVFDHLRQLGRQAEILAQYRRQMTRATDNSAEECVDEKNILNLWLGIVRQLPSQQQRVYVMIEQQGITLDEAADRLSLNKNTIKKHLELARRFVRSALKHSLQGQSVTNLRFLQIFL